MCHTVATMIAGNLNKGKGLLDRLLIPLIIILVGVCAFGLGRLSALQEDANGLVIYPASQENGESPQ